MFHIVTSQQGGSLWSSQISNPTGFSTSWFSWTSGVVDASVGVGDTLFGGAGFWGGGAVGVVAPLSVAAPLVAVLSGAGATDIAAVASSKVAAGGAWSGEWSGDAWTGSSPSDAWLGTGEAAGAAGVLSAGSDASLIALVLLLRSMGSVNVSDASPSGLIGSV